MYLSLRPVHLVRNVAQIQSVPAKKSASVTNASILAASILAATLDSFAAL